MLYVIHHVLMNVFVNTGFMSHLAIKTMRTVPFEIDFECSPAESVAKWYRGQITSATAETEAANSNWASTMADAFGKGDVGGKKEAVVMSDYHAQSSRIV